MAHWVMRARSSLLAVSLVACSGAPAPLPPAPAATHAAATEGTLVDAGGPCVPVDERCNGLDDDCDGVIDDGLPLFTPCEAKCANGVAFGGTLVCGNDWELVCEPAKGWQVCH